ncbi:hypothetical protein DCC85_14530 [Paenibacillus sp. CAA11]|uniref:hypothetical protein n=1 Tax=Paenibacillus sp. CAA11 TaxID=1532905 RepID=UPI000D371FB7|nr:hypothetical protein [Paenibacillus sp. CAA11]AWB45320.1 hypothetical protein DCC85_14530 [Paenibacillus sp. CAA11]
MADAMSNLNLDTGSLVKANNQLRAMDKYMASIEKKANSMSRNGLARQITLVDRLTESVKRLDQALRRIREQDLFKPATMKLAVQQKVQVELAGLAGLLDKLSKAGQKGNALPVSVAQTSVQTATQAITIVNQPPQVSVAVTCNCTCKGEKEEDKSWFDHLKDGVDFANSIYELKDNLLDTGKKVKKWNKNRKERKNGLPTEEEGGRTKAKSRSRSRFGNRPKSKTSSDSGSGGSSSRNNSKSYPYRQRASSSPLEDTVLKESPAAPKGGKLQGALSATGKGLRKAGSGLKKAAGGVWKGLKWAGKYGGKVLKPLGTALDVVDIVKSKNAEERGEAIGSSAGGWGGAAMGGAIGTAIFPGVGTIIGGAVGGLLGSFGGSKLGKFIGGLFSRKKKKKKAEPSPNRLRAINRPAISALAANPALQTAPEAIGLAGLGAAASGAAIGFAGGAGASAASPAIPRSRAAAPVRPGVSGTQTVQISDVQMNTLSSLVSGLKMETQQIQVNVPVGAVQIEVKDNEIDIAAISKQVSQQIGAELKRALENRKQPAS